MIALDELEWASVAMSKSEVSDGRVGGGKQRHLQQQ